MVMIDTNINEQEVQAVFNLPLGNNSLEEVAAQSEVIFVRSQIQIAVDNSRATGIKMVATEALRKFGWSILRQLSEREAVPIVRHTEELGHLIAQRRDLLGSDVPSVARAARLSDDDLIVFEEGKKQLPIRQIEHLAQVLALELYEKNISSANQEKIAVRLREFATGFERSSLSAALVLRLSEAAWIIATQTQLQAQFDQESRKNLLRLGFSPSNKYGPPPYHWGYKYAHKTRQLLGLTQNEPIPSMRALVEDVLGVPVVQADLPSQFAGATLSNGSARGIVLNLRGHNENPWIRRNTLAHEIGHLLWDPEERLNALRVDTFSDLEQEQEPDSSHDVVEARANAFAAEFLAPRDAVLQLCEGARSSDEAITRVCEKFGIGPSAARYQIQNARKDGVEYRLPSFPLIPSDEWKSSENFATDQFPPEQQVPIQRRGRFAYWVSRAAKEKIISLDTAGSFMGLKNALTKVQVRDIMDLFEG